MTSLRRLGKIRATIIVAALTLAGTTAISDTATAWPSSCTSVGLANGFNPQRYGTKCRYGTGQFQAVAKCTYPRQAARYYVSGWGTPVGAYTREVWAYCPWGWSLSTSGSWRNLRN